MKPEEIDGILAATLEDERVSRGERHALKELILDEGLTDEQLAFVRHRAFALAKERLTSGRQVLEWLEDVVKILTPREEKGPHRAEVQFSPGPGCLNAITRCLDEAREAVDICVFTITDDRLASAILAAHGRGVRLRLLTDDDKSFDRGSDIERLEAAGVPVRTDRSEHHMHHKYAVFDRDLLVTGSYNWTRSAAQHNRENLLVSDDPRLVKPYLRKFEEDWSSLG
ncbi:MAG: phospholipase D-like domain-containing protein [Myxococcota bacterium]|nr:phospholipase D-like domain-containing protein [Myxococcota bacterium]